MPYKSEKIKIAKTEFDRRIKLTDSDRAQIKIEYEMGGTSHRKLAKKYGVSRRLITLILSPEKTEAMYQRRRERMKDKKYYDKEKHAEYIREHRRYKQKLKLEGKI